MLGLPYFSPIAISPNLFVVSSLCLRAAPAPRLSAHLAVPMFSLEPEVLAAGGAEAGFRMVYLRGVWGGRGAGCGGGGRVRWEAS